MYDSHDLELASTLIKNVELENASNNYSLSNNVDEQQLYKQFVAYNCKGCSSAPLIDCA